MNLEKLEATLHSGRHPFELTLKALAVSDGFSATTLAAFSSIAKESSD
jgi:hypothetical protein